MPNRRIYVFRWGVWIRRYAYRFSESNKIWDDIRKGSSSEFREIDAIGYIDFKAMKVMNKEILHFLKEINGNTYFGNDSSMTQIICQARIEKLQSMKSKLSTSLQHTNISVSIHMLTCAL